MQSTQYPLDQSSLLLISGILSAGHEESADSLPPMEQDGPRFPYSAIRDRIRERAPSAPRFSSPALEYEENPDGEDSEAETEENNLRAYARDKQNHEFSPWVLPSARSRRDVMSEYASMGMNMND